jgi:methylated-DNA-[protein]-cysteine S-methyltransferase
MARDEALEVVAFMTDLGWMALAGRGAKLVQLAISHPSRAATLAALSTAGETRETGAPCWQKLVARLQDYAAGQRVDFRDVALELDHLGAFQRRVVAACRAIPYGQTRGYGELAARCGSPRAARAVGTTMRLNRFPIIVPCHRVISSGGGIGNYSACDGVGTKIRLLTLEGAAVGRAADRPRAARPVRSGPRGRR